MLVRGSKKKGSKLANNLKHEHIPGLMQSRKNIEMQGYPCNCAKLNSDVHEGNLISSSWEAWITCCWWIEGDAKWWLSDYPRLATARSPSTANPSQPLVPLPKLSSGETPRPPPGTMHAQGYAVARNLLEMDRSREELARSRPAEDRRWCRATALWLSASAPAPKSKVTSHAHPARGLWRGVSIYRDDWRSPEKFWILGGKR
jgi:hypothetical protein